MLWTLLKFAGIALLLFAAYLVWVLSRAGSTIGQSPTAKAEMLPDKIRVKVSFPGTDSRFRITEILLARNIGEKLGVATPSGFRREPYTPEDTEDPASQEAARWAAEANSNDIRWVGTLPLRSDTVTTLDLPIQTAVAGDIVLRFVYERKIGLGGQVSFFTVPVEAAET